MKETRKKNLIIILLTVIALALFACGGVLFHGAIPREISASAETVDFATEEVTPYDDLDAQPETCELSLNWQYSIANSINLTEISFLKTAPEGYTDSGKTSNDHIKIYRKDDDNMNIAFVFGGTITAPSNSAELFGSLTKLTAIHFDNFSTSNATSMMKMFYNCEQLKEIDLSGFDTSNVTDMSKMFYLCDQLTTLDLSSFDTSQVTDMNGMFYHCSNLLTVNLSSFNTSSVTDMAHMFNCCFKLTALDLSNFTAESLTRADRLFCGCNELTVLDLSSFNPSKLTSFSNMFDSCLKLTELDLSSFDTSSATSMNSMFAFCRSLTTLNISSFDTSSVTDMGFMFYNCESLERIDLTNFDVTSVTKSSAMFSGCNNLNKIIAPVKIGKAQLSLGCYYWNGTEDILYITSEDASTAEEGKILYRHIQHSLEKWYEEVPADCAHKGTKAHWECEVCKEPIDEQGYVIADLTINMNDNHAYDDGTVTVSPTCIKKGIETFTCTRCGNQVANELDATGHTEVSEDVIAPTCTEDGWTGGKYCSACGIILEEPLPLPATGHAYGEWQVVTSSDGQGEERRLCANDEAHFETRPLPKSTPDDIVEPPQSPLSAGAIAGIAAGATVVLLFAGYVSCYFALYRKAATQGKFLHAIYAPMNAIFKKKGQDKQN